MNIGKFTGAIKLIGLFLLANITGIFFILGLIIINCAIYLQSMQGGLIATGISFITVALIVNSEQTGGD